MPAFDVINRLRRAERAEAAAASGLAHELVSWQQREMHLATLLASAQRAAKEYPRRGPEPNEDRDAWARAENARADALREFRRLVRESGVDTSQFAGGVAEIMAPTGADFANAIKSASDNLARCQREIAGLEAERSRRGRRLGELRASLREGEEWLRSQGFATEAVYANA